MKKLLIKKTGEIVNSKELLTDEFIIDLFSKDFNYFESKLDKIKEEREVCEEDELLYVISAEHKTGYQCVLKEEYPEICKVAKELGIGFETEKECMKAVDTMKARKRLMDKGFRFILDSETEMPMFVYSGANGEKCITSAEESKQCRNDIKLLFGGEE